MTSDDRQDIKIRQAARADMSVCAAILNDWIDKTEWMPRVHDHADVVRWYETELFGSRTVLIAEREGKIDGYLAVDDSEPMITALYLRDGSCGGGIGKALLDAAKARLARPTTLWTFVENHRAQAFYKREGFVEVMRTDGDNEEKLPDILFRWSGPA